MQEHASTLTGLHVEHQLLVHVLLVHCSEELQQLVGLQVWGARKRYESHTAVVRKIDEDIVVGSTSENRLSGGHLVLFSCENSSEIGRIVVVATVVYLAANLDLVAILLRRTRLVLELSRKGV